MSISDLKNVEHLELIISKKGILGIGGYPMATSYYFKSEEEAHQYMLSVSKELKGFLSKNYYLPFFNKVKGEVPPVDTIFQLCIPEIKHNDFLSRINLLSSWFEEYLINKRKKIILENSCEDLKYMTYSDIQEKAREISYWIASLEENTEVFRITIPSVFEKRVHHLYYQIRKSESDSGKYMLTTQFIKYDLLFYLEFAELDRLSPSYLQGVIDFV